MKQPSMVIILQSIHYVMKAEKLLLKEGINHDVIPVPREISSECGMAIELADDDLKRAENLLALAGLKIIGIYQKKNRQTYLKTS